jgi:hypothetical protein
MSRNSAGDTATGYALDGRGVGVRVSVEARRPDRFWGPPSLLFSFSGAKRPGREADYLPSISA